MKTTRFLLPFVHGVDKFAIEQAVLLAKSHQAVLVPIVLFHMPVARRKKGVRLEYLQQSKDFLETVKQKADWYGVRTERLEVFTSDVVRSINLVASEMECDGILLFASQKGGILLPIQQIKGVMERPICKLYITHLPTKERMHFLQELSQRLSQWFQARYNRPVELTNEQADLDEEEAKLPIGLSMLDKVILP